MGKYVLPPEAGSLIRLAETGSAGPYVVLVPRLHLPWVGINQALELFPALAFRSPQYDAGLEALAAYPKHPNGRGSVDKG